MLAVSVLSMYESLVLVVVMVTCFSDLADPSLGSYKAGSALLLLLLLFPLFMLRFIASYGSLFVDCARLGR